MIAKKYIQQIQGIRIASYWQKCTLIDKQCTCMYSFLAECLNILYFEMNLTISYLALSFGLHLQITMYNKKFFLLKTLFYSEIKIIGI